MRMVESMAANFAHRMGNLAGVSRLASQTLRDRIDPNDQIAIRQLKLIEQRANVLMELADRLARPFKETGHMFDLKPLDLATILEEELKQIHVNLYLLYTTPDNFDFCPAYAVSTFRFAK